MFYLVGMQRAEVGFYVKSTLQGSLSYFVEQHGFACSRMAGYHIASLTACHYCIEVVYHAIGSDGAGEQFALEPGSWGHGYVSEVLVDYLLGYHIGLPKIHGFHVDRFPVFVDYLGCF